MSKLSSILEGLNERYDSDLDQSFEDLPICGNTKMFQKFLSQELTKKYKNFFIEFGEVFIDVSLYARDDNEVYVDDVLTSVEFSLVFEAKVDEKKVRNIIKRVMKNYPDMLFDKKDNTFYFELSEPEDIIEFMEAVESDRVNIKKYYSVKDEDDIRSDYADLMREWKAEKDEQERDFYRSRL